MGHSGLTRGWPRPPPEGWIAAVACHETPAGRSSSRTSAASRIQPATWERRLTTVKPACTAVRSVSRSRRQPPATASQAGAASDCRAPPRLPGQVHVLQQQQPAPRRRGPGGARRAPPPGPPPCRARTRSPRRRSSRRQTAAPPRGRRRPPPLPAPAPPGAAGGARMLSSGSSAVTRAPGAYQRQLRARTRRRSRARGRARPPPSRRRHAPPAARSNGHITASYTAAWPPAGVVAAVPPSLRLTRSFPRPPVRCPAGRRHTHRGRWARMAGLFDFTKYDKDAPGAEVDAATRLELRRVANLFLISSLTLIVLLLRGLRSRAGGHVHPTAPSTWSAASSSSSAGRPPSSTACTSPSRPGAGAGSCCASSPSPACRQAVAYAWIRRQEIERAVLGDPHRAPSRQRRGGRKKR